MKDFQDKDFQVDDFISKCRKQVSIECLRQDLDSYYRTLKSAMVELINKDYADFVSLSSNLVSWFWCGAAIFCIISVSVRTYIYVQLMGDDPLPNPLQVGMDKSINELMTPLGQLQEEILVSIRMSL